MKSKLSFLRFEQFRTFYSNLVTRVCCKNEPVSDTKTHSEIYFELVSAKGVGNHFAIWSIILFLRPIIQYNSQLDCFDKKKFFLPLEPVKTGKFQLASAPKEYFTPNPYYVKKPQSTYVRPDDGLVPSGKNFYVPFPKKAGGNKDGCFSKFPSYVGDPYGKQTKTLDDKGSKLKWVAGGPEYRSKYTTSIIEYVTKVSCNAQNYPHYVERVFPL